MSKTDPIDRTRQDEGDPLLALTGSGRALWSGEHADEYIRRLRNDWEEPARPPDHQQASDINL